MSFENYNYGPTPTNLNQEEAIRTIEQVYSASYDPHSDLSVWDQLDICESLAETEHKENHRPKENVYVSGSGNDTYKRSVNPELTESKQKAIAELKAFTYKTPPIKIAHLLEILFAEDKSKEGHWLYIAQNYNPRVINRVINLMAKDHITGRKTIQNPAAYFTHLIKFRKKRRS